MSTAAPIDPRQWLGRFGLQAFRPGQQDVIEAVLAGHDVLCVMPTGGGKSLCYQLPAVAREGLTIVVSPLIALMQDQVAGLERRGMRAALINSSLTMAEQNDRLDAMARGEYDLVYVAPERLRNGRFLEAVQQTRVSLLAIDEAHCVSEWGHDFRPDYARLGRFRQRYLQGVQTIALTATATPTVRQDVIEILQLKSPREFITGFARPNLKFSVTTCSGDADKDQQLFEFLGKQTGNGIVYAATRKRCEELAEKLSHQTHKRFGVYHAGLPVDQRRVVQEQFMAGELAAIVATNAFGMGVDKADLRYVVHYNIPGSLEAYYQEAGRAGRDGLPSECLLLFSYSDRYIQEFFIENAYPSAEAVRLVYQFLCAQPADPIELTLEEIREALKIKDLTAEAIGTAESVLARTGVLERLDAGAGNAVLRIDSDLETLVDLLPREANVRRKVLRAAEKMVGKQRYEDVYISLNRLIDLSELDREQVTRSLRELTRLKAFDYIPPFRGRAVHLRERDVPFDDLEIDFAEMERRKAAEYEKLNAVIRMAQSTACRQLSILRYFGDPTAGDCGNCDRCLLNNKPAAAKIPPGVSLEQISKGVRVALSGVARMHGRFGKTIVAQMLCGSHNQKLQQWKLNRLSTFGLLAGLQQRQVVDLLEALISSGLCKQDEVEQRRPILQLTDLGREVMNGVKPVPVDLRLAPALARRLAACVAQIASPGDNNQADEAKPNATAPVEKPKESSSAAKQSPVQSPAPPRPVSEQRSNAEEPAAKQAVEIATPSVPAESAPVDAEVSKPPARRTKPAEWDSAAPTESMSTMMASINTTTESQRDDVYWTWRLLSDGYSPEDCAAIRRISKNALVDHLVTAVARHYEVKLEWFMSGEDARLMLKIAAAGPEASPRLRGLLPNHLSPKLWELARVLYGAGGETATTSE